MKPRTLTFLAAATFAVSIAFPIVASLFTTEQRPPWLGLLDILFAAAFVIAAIAIDNAYHAKITNPDKLRSFAVIRALASLLLVLMVAYFFLAGRIDWEVLLIGLAWRMWMVVYALPAWMAAWRLQAKT